jgi:shikimate kinase
MGAGKSTVGRLLADQLDWDFVDLDAEIEKVSGISISEIFAQQGETHFRDLEAKALQKTLDSRDVVVACGGGVVTRPENVALLKTETTIWLELSPEEAAARLETAHDRPLLDQCADTHVKLAQILESRRIEYASAASTRINSHGSTPDQISQKILKQIEIPHA